MSTLIEDIKRKTEEINRIKQEMVNELRVKFKDIFIPFFDKYPEIKYFKWTQYTPYFNDGEECVFGVNDLEGYREDDEYEASLTYYNTDKFSADLRADFDELRKQFNSIEPFLLEDLFGDHAEVKVSREGIDVEEYQHD